MAGNTFNLGVKIQVKQKHANIDDLYGPYATVAAAEAAIGALMDVGRTIGIIEEDGTITEYWWMPDPKADPVTYSFVKKGANVVLEVTNLTADLEGLVEPNIYLVKNITSGVSYVLYVETPSEGKVNQTLVSSTDTLTRSKENDIWSDWVIRSNDFSEKADKVVNGTENDFVVLDEHGNIKDSNISLEDPSQVQDDPQNVYELQSNRQTSIPENPDDLHYPTTKAVKQALDAQKIVVDEELSDESTNPVQNKKVKEALDDKANTNGTYPEMAVGNLIGEDTDSVEDNRVSFIFRSTAGNQSISDGSAKVTEIFGNVVNGIPFSARKFKSVGFNAFKGDIEKQGETIHGNYLEDYALPSTQGGSIVPAESHKIAWVKVLQGFVGSGNNNGYRIRSKRGTTTLFNRVGFTISDPATTSVDNIQVQLLTAVNLGGSDNRNVYVPPQEGYLLIDVYDTVNLLVHLAWSYDPTDKNENYFESVINIPQVHTWGLAKVNTIMDEINLLNQETIMRVNRVEMSLMSWAEAAAEHQRTIIVDGEETIETYYTYTYTSTILQSLIKKSTENISYYGFSAALTASVDANGYVIIDSGETRLTSADFAGKYFYYELATPVVEPLQQELFYEVSDFGTEEFVDYQDTQIAPTYATFFYFQDLKDALRNLLMKDESVRQVDIDFGTDATLGQSLNAMGNITLVRLVGMNISGVYLTAGSIVQQYIALTNGEATIELNVADKSLMTFEIVRQTAGNLAFLAAKYKF